MRWDVKIVKDERIYDWYQGSHGYSTAEFALKKNSSFLNKDLLNFDLLNLTHNASFVETQTVKVVSVSQK